MKTIPVGNAIKLQAQNSDILRSYLHLSMEDLDAELVNAGSTRIGYLCWCCQSNLYIGEPTCQHCRPAESQHAAVEDETGGDSASCRLTWWCLPLLRKSRCEFLGYGMGRHRDSNRSQYQEEHSRLIRVKLSSRFLMTRISRSGGT